MVILVYALLHISPTTISPSPQCGSLSDKSIAINICLYTAVKTVVQPGSLAHNATYEQCGSMPYASYIEKAREKWRGEWWCGSSITYYTASMIPMTSLTLPTGVTLCHILTDFDVTQFQETLVLYPVNHMIVPYTRVYRHPLGQSCDRSTCHETRTHTDTQLLSVCVLKEEMQRAVSGQLLVSEKDRQRRICSGVSPPESAVS